MYSVQLNFRWIVILLRVHVKYFVIKYHQVLEMFDILDGPFISLSLKSPLD